MDRLNFILSVLSTSKGEVYTPAQLQKIFFLLDRNIGDKIDGPYFKFEPYHYGPFDKQIYDDLNNLASEKLVNVNFAGYNNMRCYGLTVKGQLKGEQSLQEIDKKYYHYIRDINEYVRSMSFHQLISTIYKLYPEMKTKSIFQN